MNNLENTLKNFWNNCDTIFSHNDLNDYLKSEENLFKYWENNFVNKINFSNKSVLDYGIGGGYLGKYLFEKKELKSYVGVDISTRSLKKADTILKNYKNYKLLDCENFYNNFNDSIDILVCQACIQHFPNEKYLINFLNKINSLNPETIMLQIAFNKNVIFKNSDYIKKQDVVRACYCNKEYILKYLTNYTIEYSSNIAENNYQFLILKKK